MVDYGTDYSREFLNSLETGVRPALGCTEPVALALAVSQAYQGIGEDIESIEIRLSPNIFKNGKGVGIPNTQEVGLDFAAALGAVAGDPSLGLELFQPVDQMDIARAKELVRAGRVQLDIETQEGNFYIFAQITTENHRASCEIRNSHTNITSHIRDGLVVYEKDYSLCHPQEEANYLHKISLEQIRDFIEGVELASIEFLLDGVDLNREIAQYGLDNKSGLGLGAYFQSSIRTGSMEPSAENMARMTASAACDARMSGASLPVMSSAGSGNQGIAAIIPVAALADELDSSPDSLARALAFSHLMTAYIKSYTGNLSPVCGCAIAAGIGASAAACWLLGGSDDQIRDAIRNMIGSLSGMFCDGAKGGCSLKIAIASAESISQARMAMAGIAINPSDGILSPSIGQSIKNLARLSSLGMKDADREIINIMLEN